MAPMDVDVETDTDDASICFKVTLVSASDKKKVRVPVGAGGRLSKGLAITLHKEVIVKPDEEEAPDTLFFWTQHHHQPAAVYAIITF